MHLAYDRLLIPSNAMETPDPNPFPEVYVIPNYERVKRILSHVLNFLPTEAPDFMSNHYTPQEAADEQEL